MGLGSLPCLHRVEVDEEESLEALHRLPLPQTRPVHGSEPLWLRVYVYAVRLRPRVRYTLHHTFIGTFLQLLIVDGLFQEV